MAASAFQREERIGLAVAIIAHAALIALLVIRPPAGDIVRPPERITVTLSDEVGLKSTSPDPFHDAAPDIAPTIGEPPAPEPKIAEAAPPRPVPAPVAERPRPAPVIAQRTAPDTRERRRPDRPALAPSPASRPSQSVGGSRIGSDFLSGVRGGTGTEQSGRPLADAYGPRVVSALRGAITRQLKPHWIAPQGVDAEKLVTVLAWDLNEDGTLDGPPRVVRQYGITATNRAQASRHAELAVRAVQLAAPFDLPDAYYDKWKRVQFDFDKSLSR